MELLLALLVVSPFYLWRYHRDCIRIARLKGHWKGWTQGATIKPFSHVIHSNTTFIVERVRWERDPKRYCTSLVLEATDAFSFQQRHAVPVESRHD